MKPSANHEGGGDERKLGGGKERGLGANEEGRLAANAETIRPGRGEENVG